MLQALGQNSRYGAVLYRLSMRNLEAGGRFREPCLCAPAGRFQGVEIRLATHKREAPRKSRRASLNYHFVWQRFVTRRDVCRSVVTSLVVALQLISSIDYPPIKTTRLTRTCAVRRFCPSGQGNPQALRRGRSSSVRFRYTRHKGRAQQRIFRSITHQYLYA